MFCSLFVTLKALDVFLAAALAPVSPYLMAGMLGDGTHTQEWLHE